MHPRLFRLLENHQRIDEQLRAAQQQRATNLNEIERLLGLKAKAKFLIDWFTLRPALG